MLVSISCHEHNDYATSETKYKAMSRYVANIYFSLLICRLIYEQLFGGVEMFTKRHFEKVNGFSNSFWGWGAEDDNLYYRYV